MTDVWSESAARSPACEADDHGSCPMWSPPDAGPPRLCKCVCHRPASLLETAVAERAGSLGSESDTPLAGGVASPVAARPGVNVRRLQVIGGVQLAAGAVGLLGDAKAFGALLVLTGGAALVTAARRRAGG